MHCTPQAPQSLSLRVLRAQVFVANPNKPQPINDILTNNRDKLLKYLEEFHTDKGGWGPGRGRGETGSPVANPCHRSTGQAAYSCCRPLVPTTPSSTHMHHCCRVDHC